MALETWSARLREPGAWLWLALVAGALLRAYLVLCTEGSFDVAIKQQHGRLIHEIGLLEYYRGAKVFNHPPLAGRFFAAAHAGALATDVPFRVLLRAPLALLDVVAAGVLFALFRGSPWRFVVLAGYWLHPLAWLFSAYHGNTDPAVALTALLGLLAAVRGRPLLAGAAIGLGVGIKLPVVLAAPALCFAFEGWRRRSRFAGAAFLVGVATYLPSLALEPALLYQRIFAYPGSGVRTAYGLPIWGVWAALGFERMPGMHGVSRWFQAHNSLVCLIAIAALALLNRGRSQARELGATLFGSFMLLYGLSSQWAFQYLAWSAPFWFFRGPLYTALGSSLLGGYIYAVYAVYCGNPWLLGTWDHMAHPVWPTWLRLLRDASIAFCFGSAVWIFGDALRSLRRARGAGAG